MGKIMAEHGLDLDSILIDTKVTAVPVPVEIDQNLVRLGL